MDGLGVVGLAWLIGRMKSGIWVRFPFAALNLWPIALIDRGTTSKLADIAATDGKKAITVTSDSDFRVCDHELLRPYLRTIWSRLPI